LAVDVVAVVGGDVMLVDGDYNVTIHQHHHHHYCQHQHYHLPPPPTRGASRKAKSIG